MKLKFLGAARTVTGSFFVVETGKTCFAVDCGLFQGPRSIQERNYQDFEIDPAKLDFLILTHAHIDHIGLVPKLCLSGFKGKIYCSHATQDLAEVLLPDSGHIQECEVERKNRKNKRAGKTLLEPIYTVNDAEKSLNRFRSINMDEIIELTEDVRMRFRDAGHILGSCIVELWLKTDAGEEVKIVFTGDLGNLNQPIVKDPALIESADYIIMESTYGNRCHPKLASRKEQLDEVINRAMARGGNLIIPAFAVERTQDLLYDLFQLYNEGRLDPEIDIFIDSPLAIAATEIFQNSIEFYDDTTRRYIEDSRNLHPLKLPNIKYSRTQQDSILLNHRHGNTIIISASGMCEAGRIKHHLKNNLWRQDATVLFVGYQAQGTLGRRIRDGEKLVTIHGEKIMVKANIESLETYSAHADAEGLLEWLKDMVVPPGSIFLVHGEEEAQEALAQEIEKQLDVPVYIPEWLDEIELKKIPRGEPAIVKKAVKQEISSLAEQEYLHLVLKLNDLFKENIKDAKYENIIALIKDIKEIIE